MSVAVTGANMQGIDDDRFSALFREHAPQARRLAFLLTGDGALAEDIVQDAFVQVAGRLSEIRRPEAFGAYLTRAVVNRTKSHFRATGREQARIQRYAAGLGPDREIADAVDSATRLEIWHALLRLPGRQRAVIVLRYYADLSERESARILGCREGTVKSLLSRGLAQLREGMVER